MPVLDRSAYLKMFIGNQIARCDKRACLLAGKVFTLPLYLQIAFCQGSPGFLSILKLFLLTGKASVQPLQFLLSFTIVARVIYLVALTVRILAQQTHIHPTQ